MSRVRHAVLVSLLVSTSVALAQQVIGTVKVNMFPTGVGVNPTTNKIYVASVPATIIDGATDTTTSVKAGIFPVTVAVNPVTNKIYFLDFINADSGVITVLDGATLTTTTVPVIGAYAIAINSVTNKIYVTRLIGGLIVIDGATNQTVSVPTGVFPYAVVVNEVTNTIYVVNSCAQLVNGSCQGQRGTVTVVDGATNLTQSVNVGYGGGAVALNAVTNQIYVVNNLDNSVSDIDGVLLTSTTIPVNRGPTTIAVNPVTDKIYVGGDDEDLNITIIDGPTHDTQTLGMDAPTGAMAINTVTNTTYVLKQDGTVTAINGNDLSLVTLQVPNDATNLAINPATNRTYVPYENDNIVSVIGGASPPPLRFIPITPCRVVDTRNANGPFGGPAIQGQTSRDFPLSQGACGIPNTAAAYSLNVAVVPRGTLSYLTVWPTGEDRPLVATLNSIDGRTKSNAAIVPAGANRAISVFATQTTDVILDVNGYFVPASQSDALAFYPLTPCRVVDTRGANGPLGGPNLVGGKTRDFPIRTDNTCDIPPTAVAYSLNFAVVPQGPLSYLTAWPSDQQQPVVATLNDPKGATTANAAIVPGAASNGDINVYATANTALIIDVNGYFAPASSGGLSLYAVAPCRVLDTRQTSGAFTGTLAPIPVENSACAVNALAQAYVFNATAIPQGGLGYLTLWPDTETRPVAATLNAPDGAITNNMAIVPTLNGAIDAYAAGTTNLILDIFGFFAP